MIISRQEDDIFHCSAGPDSDVVFGIRGSQLLQINVQSTMLMTRKTFASPVSCMSIERMMHAVNQTSPYAIL